VQVVVLLLLVAGLALLVLGLITGSTPLVVGSIAASLLAAMAMLRYRRRQEAGVAASPAPAVTPPAAPPEERRQDAALRTAERAPVLASVSAEPVAELVAEPAQVAAPPAHAAAEPDRVAAEPAHAHPEEPAQPVAEGISATGPVADTEEVAGTDPGETDPDAADTDPPLRSRGDEPVWVVDGRPRYHLPGCAFLIGRGPEPVPLRQAVEDGFTPCALCDPDTGLAAR
jgi:hypothetical protein